MGAPNRRGSAGRNGHLRAHRLRVRPLFERVQTSSRVVRGAVQGNRLAAPGVRAATPAFPAPTRVASE